MIYNNSSKQRLGKASKLTLNCYWTVSPCSSKTAVVIYRFRVQCLEETRLESERHERFTRWQLYVNLPCPGRGTTEIIHEVYKCSRMGSTTFLLLLAVGYDRANFWLMQSLEIPSAFSMPSARVLALVVRSVQFISLCSNGGRTEWCFIHLEYSFHLFFASIWNPAEEQHWKNIFADGSREHCRRCRVKIRELSFYRRVSLLRRWFFQ